jgi:hypothetical protein
MPGHGTAQIEAYSPEMGQGGPEAPVRRGRRDRFTGRSKRKLGLRRHGRSSSAEPERGHDGDTNLCTRFIAASASSGWSAGRWSSDP